MFLLLQVKWRPGSEVWLSPQGEMCATVFKYPGQYQKLIGELRSKIGSKVKVSGTYAHKLGLLGHTTCALFNVFGQADCTVQYAKLQVVVYIPSPFHQCNTMPFHSLRGCTVQ